jgi:2-methylfumaryl-CoA hydratase
MAERILIDGPYFEDFKLGDVFEDAPALTLSSGHAALHQALFGDRLRLPLDAELCQRVTGSDRPLANPSLVCNAAIGQTTYASQRVKGNLFYRGLILRSPVFLGDTLRTTTEVVALKQNRIKPGRPASGMVVLEMTVANQRRETVLHFWRCPMIPCRDPEADTGQSDSFDAIPADLDMADVQAAVCASWNLEAFRQATPGAHFTDLRQGSRYAVEGRDTVTCAPELVRMTLNMAATHTDAGASAYGKRLVYGGHTISMGAAQITRALPNLVTLVAWRSCDHTAPVFENDILRTEVEIGSKHPLAAGGGLVDLNVEVFAERGDQAPEPGQDIQVLDWHVLGLFA